MTFRKSTDQTNIENIHSYCRPHNSQSESDFIAKFIDIIPGIEIDGYGNRMVQIGESDILWSCHTDSVHKAKGRQNVIVVDGVMRLKNQDKGYVLGADDGAGVWLCLEMIKHKIPGLYVFHRAEEIGGLGSGYIADHTPSLLSNINFAIAFDRKGKDSIITHQGFRCCSDSFAYDIAGKIPLNGFKLDDTGTFTDTANYAHLVSECTNISCGYETAHSRFETLDIDYLISLRDALLKADFSSLVFHRDNTADEIESYPYDDEDYFMDKAYTYQDLIMDNSDVALDVLESFGIDKQAFTDFLNYRDYN